MKPSTAEFGSATPSTAELVAAELVDVELVDAELFAAELIWVDFWLAELPGVPPLLDATPAWTRELPGQNITMRKIIAIRLISPLLQLLSHDLLVFQPMRSTQGHCPTAFTHITHVDTSPPLVLSLPAENLRGGEEVSPYSPASLQI